MINPIVNKIRKELSESADEKTRLSSLRFFREKVKVYGVKASLVTKISKQYLAEIEILGKDEAYRLCEELFRSGYCEEAWLAAGWVDHFQKSFEEKDFAIFETWIDKYIDNWAECDTFCNHSIGSFIFKYPAYIKRLKKWAVSENRWFRRAAAVTLIIPAKEGLFLKDIFEIADILLTDKDDMVQKGYGWLLKEASRKHQQEVFDYVVKHKAVMPRTALRYAIEKMPQQLRKEAMSRE